MEAKPSSQLPQEAAPAPGPAPGPAQGPVPGASQVPAVPPPSASAVSGSQGSPSLTISSASCASDSGISKKSMPAPANNITLEELQQYFHLPSPEAAKQIGISVNILKKACRALNIKKWPYRQINGIVQTIESLKILSKNTDPKDPEKKWFTDQIAHTEGILSALMDNPNFAVELNSTGHLSIYDPSSRESKRSGVKSASSSTMKSTSSQPDAAESSSVGVEDSPNVSGKRQLPTSSIRQPSPHVSSMSAPSSSRVTKKKKISIEYDRSTSEPRDIKDPGLSLRNIADIAPQSSFEDRDTQTHLDSSISLPVVLPPIIRRSVGQEDEIGGDHAPRKILPLRERRINDGPNMDLFPISFIQSLMKPSTASEAREEGGLSMLPSTAAELQRTRISHHDFISGDGLFDTSMGPPMTGILGLNSSRTLAGETAIRQQASVSSLSALQQQPTSLAAMSSASALNALSVNIKDSASATAHLDPRGNIVEELRLLTQLQKHEQILQQMLNDNMLHAQHLEAQLHVQLKLQMSQPQLSALQEYLVKITSKLELLCLRTMATVQLIKQDLQQTQLMMQSIQAGKMSFLTHSQHANALLISPDYGDMDPLLISDNSYFQYADESLLQNHSHQLYNQQQSTLQPLLSSTSLRGASVGGYLGASLAGQLRGSGFEEPSLRSLTAQLDGSLVSSSGQKPSHRRASEAGGAGGRRLGSTVGSASDTADTDIASSGTLATAVAALGSIGKSPESSLQGSLDLAMCYRANANSAPTARVSLTSTTTASTDGSVNSESVSATSSSNRAHRIG